MSSYLLEARHTLYRARDNLQAAEETLRRARLAMGDAQKALESAERDAPWIFTRRLRAAAIQSKVL